METRNVCLNGVRIVRYTKCSCGSITLEFAMELTTVCILKHLNN